MKQRLTALLCALAALLTLLIPWTLAADPYDNVYIVGVNDTVLLSLISAEQMPVRRSGTVYVPYTILDNKELGLSYALNRSGGTFTVYNRKKTLIFQLDGSGSADKEDNEYTWHIISRNGVVFIPLRFVAAFFDLSYSTYNVALADGTVPMIRVCTAQASLSNPQFAASTTQLIAGPLGQYVSSQATPTPTAEVTPVPTVTPRPGTSPEPSPSARPDPASLCFAVRCTDGEGFQNLLDAFSRLRVSALFLFSPDDLVHRDADVRAAAAAGHQIGLLLDSQDPEGSFRRGNELLSHILRAEATQVAFTDGASVQGNWWIWSGNVSVRGRNAAAQAANLADDVSSLRLARVTLNDSRVTAQALQRNVGLWSQRPYTLFTPTESL